MVKECKVIFNNDAVTVVKYCDTVVQLPSIMKDAKTVFVDYENGKYSVVNHTEENNVEIIKDAEQTKVETKKNKKTIKSKHYDAVDD